MDHITDDVPISEARANITDVIASVRLLRRCVFLTRRDKPQAAVIPVELGQLIRQVGGVDAAAAILTGHVPRN
ncbi:type II toxin-antitoxin system Phd/YefM family antitoxin [Kitasatospora sp. NBC_00240]|uniref:prevent-host-death family protein n=1 Tax=Kitasatospora sp. NBC_00240 TaxID=2903567 RepID=UPI00224DED07|nr:prevent-host-death family protein [Kitasatospora sp. NBC_00240]MCX5209726.1 type II toxin-antitoxin system Phd/YefM family antitoxin [Kitasatospora sp. NBC_00240]